MIVLLLKNLVVDFFGTFGILKLCLVVFVVLLYEVINVVIDNGVVCI